jgi:uncharacterized protein (TIGR02452 family)
MKNLISVFEDTFEFSENMLNSVTTKHTFSEIITPQKIISSKKNIKVINTDSVSALVEYSKEGKTCVLNMASYKHPGGGVKNGARAQEECLFRCSNLTHVVKELHYPLKTNECLYTENAVFFKDFYYDYMDDILVDVVTIAAINLNSFSKYDDIQKDLDYMNVTKNKIRLMLSLAIKNDVKNIILGAFGCGVFNNDPQIMSNLFHEILIREGYSNYFDNVVFAIINDHNSVGNNFDIFNKNLK